MEKNWFNFLIIYLRKLPLTLNKSFITNYSALQKTFDNKSYIMRQHIAKQCAPPVVKDGHAQALPEG